MRNICNFAQKTCKKRCDIAKEEHIHDVLIFRQVYSGGSRNNFHLKTES